METGQDIPEDNSNWDTQPEQATDVMMEEPLETRDKSSKPGSQERSSFVNGLAVGLGVGCIATFVIVWISVFFTPRLPSEVTYENLLSIFVYPLIYLLAVGLIGLTAGIVREYYAARNKN
jgi:fructose-specific phosphotransferase system IIC component